MLSVFSESIPLNKQVRHNEACGGDIGVQGRLNQYAEYRYSTRFAVDSFI